MVWHLFCQLEVFLVLGSRVVCLQEGFIDGLQIFLLSWFYHCFWFDGTAGCYVIWCCHSSLFQKAFWTVFSWLLNGKRLVCFCVCIVSYVSHWACVYFCFGFSFAELILWCFPFGFRESSFSLPVFCLCFMVLNCIWWVCSLVCSKESMVPLKASRGSGCLGVGEV